MELPKSRAWDRDSCAIIYWERLSGATCEVLRDTGWDGEDTRQRYGASWSLASAWSHKELLSVNSTPEMSHLQARPLPYTSRQCIISSASAPRGRHNFPGMFRKRGSSVMGAQSDKGGLGRAPRAFITASTFSSLVLSWRLSFRLVDKSQFVSQ